MIQLILITDDPVVAAASDTCGVDQVMVDLESRGKAQRQRGRNTVISRHKITDITAIRAVLRSSKLLVRINPWSADSPQEVEAVLDAGADSVMLPMFTRVEEVEKLVSAVRGRAECCLLLETGAALARVHQFLEVEGIGAVHVGLNDLHMSLGLDFMFELLSGGIVEYLAEQIVPTGVRFGFGGVGRIGHGKVPAQMILAEHVRLGSQQVILSRDFRNAVTDVGIGSHSDLRVAVDEIRQQVHEIGSWNKEQFAANAADLRASVQAVVKSCSREPR
jgi:hypothetical protein